MATPSYTYTAEFQEELESERTRLLRRRFLWFSGLVAAFASLGTLTSIVIIWLKFGAQVAVDLFTLPALGIPFLATFASITLYAIAFVRLLRKPMEQAPLLRLVFTLIVTTGCLQILATPLGDLWHTDRVIRIDSSTTVPAQKQSTAANGPSDQPAPAAEEPATTPEPVDASAHKPAHVEIATPFSAAPKDDIPIGNSIRLKKQPDGTYRPKYPDADALVVVIALISAASIFIRHFIASLFLPWTWRESLRPVAVLYGLFFVLVVVYTVRAKLFPPESGDPSWLVYLIAGCSIVFLPVMLLPGLGVCLWRSSRFRDRVHLGLLKGRYSEFKRELVDARRIHESLFPAPITSGAVHLRYRYEPMRQIGGDYLYARSVPSPDRTGSHALNVVLVDVTGHGITAALTVNRLHGEIDRQLGERPDATPGDLLEGLNNYLHHTLANHSVYATALCLRVVPHRNELMWASAGHPPAFLLTADGRLDRLDSTTLVLGACRGEDFPHNQQTMRFHPGDAVLAYTDGAIECRNAQGRMLGLAGIQAMIARLGEFRHGAVKGNGSCVELLMEEISAFRSGATQDDTLIVELARPV